MSEEISKAKKNAPKSEKPAEREAASELRQPIWSVISFDEIIAADLAYEAATEILRQKQAKKIAGLCIITNEAATRMKQKNK